MTEEVESGAGVADSFPLSLFEMINRGTNMEKRLGMRTYDSRVIAVTLPWTQSMIVVTSPIGDQAPPLW